MSDIIEEIIQNEDNAYNKQKKTKEKIIENYKAKYPEQDKQKVERKNALEDFKKQQQRFHPYILSHVSNEEKMNNAINFFTSLYEEANSLISKNQELKDYAEKRSNEEIFELKNKEIEELKQRIYSLEVELSQHLSLKEVEEVNEWYQKHSKSKKNESHKIHLEYFTTHLDPGIEISCSCGEKHYIWR